MRQVIKQQSTEKIAEDYISMRLLSSEIIPAKPKLDINGADFLAILEVEDGSKFARIQCKGRVLSKPKSSSSVSIEASYVKGTFTCLLYIKYLADNTDYLFCFFTHDIKTSNLWLLKEKKYYLNLYGTTFKERLRLFYFNEDRVRALKEMITASDSRKEFRYIFGEGNLTLPALQCKGTGGPYY